MEKHHLLITSCLLLLVSLNSIQCWWSEDYENENSIGSRQVDVSEAPAANEPSSDDESGASGSSTDDESGASGPPTDDESGASGPPTDDESGASGPPAADDDDDSSATECLDMGELKERVRGILKKMIASSKREGEGSMSRSIRNEDGGKEGEGEGEYEGEGENEAEEEGEGEGEGEEEGEYEGEPEGEGEYKKRKKRDLGKDVKRRKRYIPKDLPIDGIWHHITVVKKHSKEDKSHTDDDDCPLKKMLKKANHNSNKAHLKKIQTRVSVPLTLNKESVMSARNSVNSLKSRHLDDDDCPLKKLHRKKLAILKKNITEIPNDGKFHKISKRSVDISEYYAGNPIEDMNGDGEHRLHKRELSLELTKSSDFKDDENSLNENLPRSDDIASLLSSRKGRRPPSIPKQEPLSLIRSGRSSDTEIKLPKSASGARIPLPPSGDPPCNARGVDCVGINSGPFGHGPFYFGEEPTGMNRDYADLDGTGYINTPQGPVAVHSAPLREQQKAEDRNSGGDDGDDDKNEGNDENGEGKFPEEMGDLPKEYRPSFLSEQLKAKAEGGGPEGLDEEEEDERKEDDEDEPSKRKPKKLKKSKSKTEKRKPSKKDSKKDSKPKSRMLNRAQVQQEQQQQRISQWNGALKPYGLYGGGLRSRKLNWKPPPRARMLNWKAPPMMRRLRYNRRRAMRRRMNRRKMRFMSRTGTRSMAYDGYFI